MKRFLSRTQQFFRTADVFLLVVCIITTIYGIIIISSAAIPIGATRYVVIQSVSLALGIAAYIIISFVDIDIIAERRELLFIFNIIFIGSLFFLGVEGETGNKSWIRLNFLPIGIQPAEVCKITFIIIMAKQMNMRRDRLNTPFSIGLFAGHLLIMIGLITVISSDLGSAIVYAAIFIVMALAAGIRPAWFLAGAGAVGAASPIIWQFLRDYQKQRIMVVFDPTIDPDAQTIRYQMKQTLTALGGGRLYGQGLYNGSLTQTKSIPAQHTDSIFAVMGEELGLIGCVVLLVLLSIIIIRCIYVGIKTNSFMNRLICFGIAGMLMFQSVINIGMCLGIMPVIGITLPFISYGGTSVLTMFIAMGIISSIKMHPSMSTVINYVYPPVNVERP